MWRCLITKERFHAVVAILAVASLLAVSVVVILSSPSAQGVRRLDIPFEEHGYGEFESIALRSQDDVDGLLNRNGAQKQSWNKRADFQNAIRGAVIDYEKEALVLLRHTEPSGSIQVRYRRPYFDSTTLICDIARDVPHSCTEDMAYYCAAFVVPLANVNSVELRVEGKPTAVLQIKTPP